MRQVFMAPKDLYDPATVIKCRENGIGTVQRRHNAEQRQNNLFNVLKEKRKINQSESLQSFDVTIKMWKTPLEKTGSIF